MKGLITTLLVGVSEATNLQVLEGATTVDNLNGANLDLSDLADATNVNIFNFFGPIYGNIYGLDDDELPSDEGGDEGDDSQAGDESDNQGTGSYNNN